VGALIVSNAKVKLKLNELGEVQHVEAIVELWLQVEISRRLRAFRRRLVDIRKIFSHVLEGHKLTQVALAVAIGLVIMVIVGQANSITR